MCIECSASKYVRNVMVSLWCKPPDIFLCILLLVAEVLFSLGRFILLWYELKQLLSMCICLDHQTLIRSKKGMCFERISALCRDLERSSCSVSENIPVVSLIGVLLSPRAKMTFGVDNFLFASNLSGYAINHCQEWQFFTTDVVLAIT